MSKGPPAPMDPQQRAEARIGTLLDDKWTLERLLGVGGMAAVYAGRHRNGARGAVKILHPELSREPEVRERFLREGYAANRVEHPGTVQVLDDDVVKGGPEQGTAYLVMELLEGESVDARAKAYGKPMPEGEVLSIADDVLAVLEAAHDKGIVHRDLKPDNLFLARASDRDGEVQAERVKVLDFGIARLLSYGGITTRVGLALGTPSYMSPEQAAGKSEEIDGRTDLFALGATMFRLLTGQRIHDGDSTAEIVTKMAKLPAPPIRTVAPLVSNRVATIVDRSLRFRREDRYESAAAMHADVHAAREGRALPSDSDFAADGRARANVTALPSAGHSEPISISTSGARPSAAFEPTLAAPDVAAPNLAAPEVADLRPAPIAPTRPRKKPRRSRAGVVGFAWVLVVAALGVGFFALREKLLRRASAPTAPTVVAADTQNAVPSVASALASAEVASIVPSSDLPGPSPSGSGSASASASAGDDEEEDDPDASVPSASSATEPSASVGASANASTTASTSAGSPNASSATAPSTPSGSAASKPKTPVATKPATPKKPAKKKKKKRWLW